MLEWMHDQDLVENLQANFQSCTLTDCENFIRRSWEDANNLHMAAVNDENIYMGTVSLKNIDRDFKCAEFAIAFRRCALGTGISGFAMKEILRYGLEMLDLEQIYWYVSSKNARAVRFYDKCGYPRLMPEALHLPANSSIFEIPNVLFYAVTKAQFKE